MRRGLAIAAALLAWPGAASAAVAWGGGGAPDGINGDLLAVEADGTLVAETFNDGFAMAPPGRPFRLLAPEQRFADPQLLQELYAVAGGLRALALDGGLWASGDHGRTWTFLSDMGHGVGDEEDGVGVLSVAIDAAHPDRAVRVFADGGVQRSTDGGRSWFSAVPVDPVGLGAGLPASTKAVFGPDGALLVQMGNRLWRSTDLGDNWLRLPNAPAGQIQVSPAAAGVLWIVAASGVFRSEDGGATWHRRHRARRSGRPVGCRSGRRLGADAHDDGDHHRRRCDLAAAPERAERDRGGRAERRAAGARPLPLHARQPDPLVQRRRAVRGRREPRPRAGHHGHRLRTGSVPPRSRARPHQSAALGDDGRRRDVAAPCGAGGGLRERRADASGDVPVDLPRRPLPAPRRPALVAASRPARRRVPGRRRDLRHRLRDGRRGPCGGPSAPGRSGAPPGSARAGRRSPTCRSAAMAGRSSRARSPAASTSAPTAAPSST